jgi:alpha-tubulin suppressor-like RCC1 family protein
MTSPLFRRLFSALPVAALTLPGLITTAYASEQTPTPDTATTVVGWGHNASGETTVPASLGGETVTALAAGSSHTLAVTSDGSVTAWGSNSSGQATVPSALSGKRVTAVAASGISSLALIDDGTIVGWGASDYGLNAEPAALNGQTVTAISAGDAHALALTSSGSIVAWGADWYGQTDVPASLSGKTVTAVSAGPYDSLALTSDGKVTAWGMDNYGETQVPSSLDGQDVIAISAGFEHSMALTSQGKVVVWGGDNYGERDVPSSLNGATVVAISAGVAHCLALTSDGKVTAWGWNVDGATTVPGTLAGYHVSAIAAGPYDSFAIGTPAPTLTLSGSPTVSGIAEVGQTLTATSATVTPEATLSGQWLRDGAPIDGATSTTYGLTNADAGSQLSYRVTASKPGYDEVSATSVPTSTVDGGVIALPRPVISGDAVVDSPLTGTVSGVEPADARLTWTWTRGEAVVGHDNTYTPTAADVGQPLTLTTTATKAHFDDVTSSATTADVAKATFATGPSATITGLLKVGATLTADEGTVAPLAAGYAYQWYADGHAIDAGTSRTLHLTAAQRHTSISVRVTAQKVGYVDAVDSSVGSADVATELAPGLHLGASRTTLRRGQSTTLRWSTLDATRLLAAGGWRGHRSTRGAKTVAPTAIGTTTYRLSASNDNGTTTAQVAISVTRPARHLRVRASTGLRLRGSGIAVHVSGLDRAEHYTLRVAGRKVATGTASSSGRNARTVRIPTATRTGTVRVTVTGSEADRIGADTVRVVAPKHLGLALAKAQVRASDRQTVTVSRLVPRERVTVTYQGHRISRAGARANAHGTWTGSVSVGQAWGTRTIKATGQYPSRNARATFQVVRRCVTGHVCA